MSFEDLDLNNTPEEEPVVAEQSSNRTFLIIAGALGAIALLALICIAVFALVVQPQYESSQIDQKSTVEAQDTAVAGIVAGTATAAMQTDIVAAYTDTPTVTPIPPTATATMTPTPVVAMPTTNASAQVSGGAGLSANATATARYATLEAIVTMNAATATIRVEPTKSQMPDTGFADDLGIPTMIGLALVLVVVMFLARRLRSA